MKQGKTYNMPPTTERAEEAQRFFGEVIHAMYGKERKGLALKMTKPTRIAGGCLLYRFPANPCRTIA